MLRTARPLLDLPGRAFTFPVAAAHTGQLACPFSTVRLEQGPESAVSQRLARRDSEGLPVLFRESAEIPETPAEGDVADGCPVGGVCVEQFLVRTAQSHATQARAGAAAGCNAAIGLSEQQPTAEPRDHRILSHQVLTAPVIGRNC